MPLIAIKESDVIILKNLKLILQPIREITDNLAGDSYVTGSAILPIVSSLKLKLSVERIISRTNRHRIEQTTNSKYVFGYY